MLEAASARVGTGKVGRVLPGGGHRDASVAKTTGDPRNGNI